MRHLQEQHLGHVTMRCPSCLTKLGDIPIAIDSIACPQCNYNISWDGDCWDACVDKTYPRDLARQWVLWEAGKLGDPNLIYGKPATVWFQEFLESTALTPKQLVSMRILEIGFGHGRLLHKLQQLSSAAYGLDLSRPLKSAQLRPGSAIFGNLLSNPLQPYQFDLVICRGVIPMTPDPQKSFDCVAEQVAPGGMLYLGGLYEPGKGDLILRRIFPWCWYYPEWLRLGIAALFAPMRGALEAFRTKGFGWKEFRRAHYKLDIFDVISPRWTTLLTEDVVLPWFASQGFLARKVAYGAYVGIKRNGISPL